MRESVSPAYLDLRGLSEYSSVSVRVWREILKQEDGPPCIRCRGKILIHKPDVDAYFERLKHSPGEEVNRVVGEVMADMTGGRG